MKKSIIIAFAVLLVFVMFTSVAFSQNILLDDCIDCLPHVIAKNWPAAIACGVTAAVGALIRYFEKRKIEKNLKK